MHLQADNFVVWNSFVGCENYWILWPFLLVIKDRKFSVCEPGNVSWKFMDHGRNARSMSTNIIQPSVIRSCEGDFSQKLDLVVLNMQVICFYKSLGLKKYLTVLQSLNLGIEYWPLRRLKPNLDSNSLLSQSLKRNILKEPNSLQVRMSSIPVNIKSIKLCVFYACGE